MLLADGVAIPFLQGLVAANRTLIWYEQQASVHGFGSFAWTRRSRWGSARGWPVFSSQFCPTAAPHMGHGTARLCLGFNSLIMVGMMRQNGMGWLVSFGHVQTKNCRHI
jgi:hypothetical protein